MRWFSHFLINRAWCGVLVSVAFITSVPLISQAQQCSFDAEVTAPDDERGHGVVVRASGGYYNGVSVELCHYWQCPQLIPRQDAIDFTPVEMFFSFECLRPGDYTWRAQGFCHNKQGREHEDEWFIDTFTVADRLRRFDVQVLNTAAGNVRIDYDIDPSKRDAVIYIPGVAGAFQFVEGSGTVIFSVPPGTYKVTAAWCPGGPNEGLHVKPIEVKGNTPPDVIFNVAPTDKVLIHKYRDDDQYPSPMQTADGQVRINAVVRTAAGTPVAGQTVQFRVIDPPDTAPYVVRAGDDRVDDNFDGPGRINGEPVATAVTNAAGAVSVTLAITSFAAGDNYQIEAIASPVFDCSLGRCTKSQVYTAWKRVYVEVNKMFRRGAYLSEPAQAGAHAIRVREVRAFPTAPFRVRLIHARAVGDNGGRDPFFYDEIAHVIAVEPDLPQPDGTVPGRLLLDPAQPGLAHGYDQMEAVGPPGQRTRRPYLADAVGVITGVRDADYFLPNGKFVKSTFADAFVEHVWLTDAGAGDLDLDATQLRLFHDAAVPYERELDDLETDWLEMKWAKQVVVPSVSLGTPAWPTNLANHQILFTGSNKPGLLGQSTVASGFSTVWHYVTAVGTGRLGGETLTHELTHQWLVNPVVLARPTIDAGGHCDSAHNRELKMYNHRDLTCVMNSGLYGNPNLRERADGILGFHYVRAQAGVDSEYLRIRQRPEPVPHNEKTRPLPQ